jgi:hypothetical protein
MEPATDAFCLDNPKEFIRRRAKPAATDELIAFRALPDFRMVEIVGALLIDVSQITFPDTMAICPFTDGTRHRLSASRSECVGYAEARGLKIARFCGSMRADGDSRFAIESVVNGRKFGGSTPPQDRISARGSGGGQGQLITETCRMGRPG